MKSRFTLQNLLAFRELRPRKRDKSNPACEAAIVQISKTGVASLLIIFLLGLALGHYFDFGTRSVSAENFKLLELARSTQIELQSLKDYIQKMQFESKLNRPNAKPSSGDVVTATQSLESARKLSSEKRFREAEIVLSRAVQTDHDNVVAWQELAAVQRKMALTSAGTAEFVAAGQALDRAKHTVAMLTGLSVDPSIPSLDPKTVVQEEAANAEVGAKVREAIDAASAEWIASAGGCAQNAHNGAWRVVGLGIMNVKNDRDEVINGLKHLRKVFELGPWASETTRSEANSAYSALKKLVYSEEWNDLLARAGFDPTSRDTLKKWSLE